LGHINYKTLKRISNLDLFPRFHIHQKHKCEIYMEAKLIKAPLYSIDKSIEPLDLIHIDIYDLKFVQTRGGKKYFITSINDCIKYYYVYLLKSKDEVLEMFKHFKREVGNQLSKKIKVIRSDRGGEYDSNFDIFCNDHGIFHQNTTPYSPQ